MNNAKAAVEALKSFEMPADEKKALMIKLAAARQKEMGRGDRGGNRRGGNRRGAPGGGRRTFNRAPRAATNTK